MLDSLNLSSYLLLCLPFVYSVFLSCMSNTCLDWIYTMQLLERQGTPCPKKVKYLKFNACKRNRTHSHLVPQQTLNHLARLAKWMSCVVSTYLYSALTVYHVTYAFIVNLHSAVAWNSWMSRYSLLEAGKTSEI